jgi:hypothetical protein
LVWRALFLAPLLSSWGASAPLKRVREQHSAVVSDEVVLAESTVHRLLGRRGLTRKPSEPTSKDHRRFEYEAAGELWMSDVMYGPKIRDQRQQRRTYLISMASSFSAAAISASERG